jgi:hypothetical protein
MVTEEMRGVCLKLLYNALTFAYLDDFLALRLEDSFVLVFSLVNASLPKPLATLARLATLVLLRFMFGIDKGASSKLAKVLAICRTSIAGSLSAIPLMVDKSSGVLVNLRRDDEGRLSLMVLTIRRRFKRTTGLL